MKLSDELRDIATSANVRGDLVRLAADIIDSLPKARNGDPIWEGCWCVAVPDGEIEPPQVIQTDGVEVAGDIFDSNDRAWALFEIASTHRTCEEADAAARLARGEA